MGTGCPLTTAFGGNHLRHLKSEKNYSQLMMNSATNTACCMLSSWSGIAWSLSKWLCTNSASHKTWLSQSKQRKPKKEERRDQRDQMEFQIAKRWIKIKQGEEWDRGRNQKCCSMIKITGKHPERRARRYEINLRKELKARAAWMQLSTGQSKSKEPK